MKTKQDIQSELQEVIANEPGNLDKILSLTRELALADTDNVRFSVDAGVIDRLGRELVARHETAVSELVKNAYDADAGHAKLYFSNVDNVGGQLIIEDDGNGMNREQLVNGFMRISSSDKVHNPLSPIYGRKRAGKKGIGRFSTQRLGNILTIITQTEIDQQALKVTINWDDYGMDKDLFSISNAISIVPKEKLKGTTLIISNLREWWTDAMIKRVYRYAIGVIQPFPLSKQDSINEDSMDIGFNVECYKNDNPIADTQSMFYDHALAEIEGSVDENGLAFWKITNSKLPEVITLNPQYFSKEDKDESIPFQYLTGVELKVYYFVYNIGMIPKQVETYITSISNEQSGIRVYRNGFRVLPYGEPNDDWVELDESVRKRKFLQVHGNHNFFGIVEITGDNPHFIELSSREGFLNNEAYNELVNFVYKCLTSATLRVSSERGVKTKTNQKDWEAKYSRSPREKVEDAVETLEELARDFEKDVVELHPNATDEEKKRKKTENQEKAKKAREQAERLKETIQEIEEINMLRVLAGLGIVIGEFTHEIAQYLSPFEIDTNHLVQNLEAGSEEHKIAIDLQDRFRSFRVYSSYFDETISENVNRELNPIDLRMAIDPFFETMDKDLERNNISVEIVYSDLDLYTCKMHMSEWASILFNLYSNAKKALRRKNPRTRKILIKAGKDNEKVFVEFIDNGDGIPTENREKIFNAFFTTSSPKSRKQNTAEELTGTGLGLKIIKDLIESYQGEVLLDIAPTGYSTNIRIDLPLTQITDIDDENF